VTENQDAAPDLSALAEADASELAGMVAEMPDEQLAAGFSDAEARDAVLGEIFRRMADHVEPENIKELEAVIHFRITEAPNDQGVDIYEVVFKDGTVAVLEEPTTEQPKVSFQVAPVPFLRLVTGAESGPALFMTGRIKIQGDLMFASRMTSFFRIPGG
jgi:putative sterol carrier protein